MIRLSENGYRKTFTEQKEEIKIVSILRKNFFMCHHIRKDVTFTDSRSNQILKEFQTKKQTAVSYFILNFKISGRHQFLNLKNTEQ